MSSRLLLGEKWRVDVSIFWDDLLIAYGRETTMVASGIGCRLSISTLEHICIYLLFIIIFTIYLDANPLCFSVGRE